MQNPYKQYSRINPQREDGRREIANDVWHALIRAGLTGGEYQCVMVIIDKTWGFDRQDFPIPLSYFVSTTGLSRPGVAKTLNNLEEKHIVYSQQNTTHTTIYGFNKHFDTWRLDTGKLEFTSQEDPTTERAHPPASKPEFTSASKLVTPATEPVKKHIKESIKESIKERASSSGYVGSDTIWEKARRYLPGDNQEQDRRR